MLPMKETYKRHDSYVKDVLIGTSFKFEFCLHSLGSGIKLGVFIFFCLILRLLTQLKNDFRT
jgi:hypothetical protein